MEIKIGTGLGKACFGFTQKALVATLGPPDQKRRNEHGDALLYYNDIQTMFRFETSHSNRLGWLETDNPKCTLMGKNLFRMSKDRIIAFVQKEFGAELEVTDYDSFQCYFFEDIWLELQFRFGRLKTVCLGVLFRDEDRVNWPKIPNQ